MITGSERGAGRRALCSRFATDTRGHWLTAAALCLPLHPGNVRMDAEACALEQEMEVEALESIFMDGE